MYLREDVKHYSFYFLKQNIYLYTCVSNELKINLLLYISDAPKGGTTPWRKLMFSYLKHFINLVARSIPLKNYTFFLQKWKKHKYYTNIFIQILIERKGFYQLLKRISLKQGNTSYKQKVGVLKYLYTVYAKGKIIKHLEHYLVGTVSFRNFGICLLVGKEHNTNRYLLLCFYLLMSFL